MGSLLSQTAVRWMLAALVILALYGATIYVSRKQRPDDPQYQSRRSSIVIGVGQIAGMLLLCVVIFAVLDGLLEKTPGQIAAERVTAANARLTSTSDVLDSWQEEACVAGIHAAYMNARTWSRRAVVSVRSAGLLKVRMTFRLQLPRKTLDGMAECHYPISGGAPTRAATFVETTSNDVTETFTAKQLVCFNRGTYC